MLFSADLPRLSLCICSYHLFCISIYYSLSSSLSLTHTRRDTVTRTGTLTHTQTHAYIYTDTHSGTCTRTYTHTHTHRHTLHHSQLCLRFPSPSLPYTSLPFCPPLPPFPPSLTFSLRAISAATP